MNDIAEVLTELKGARASEREANDTQDGRMERAVREDRPPDYTVRRAVRLSAAPTKPRCMSVRTARAAAA
jgi:hypothetical protein